MHTSISIKKMEDQNPLLVLWWNFSVPDADFSSHPAHLTKSAEKCHQSIVAYCTLWLKYCDKITTQNISTFYEEMWFSSGFSIAENTQPRLCKWNLCTSQVTRIKCRLPLCDLPRYEEKYNVPEYHRSIACESSWLLCLLAHSPSNSFLHTY